MPMDKKTYEALFGSESSGPVDTYKRTQQEVDNLKTRLGSVGQDTDTSSPGPLIKLLRLLVRPGESVFNAAREYTNPNAGSTPGVLDPGAAYMRGLTGKEENPRGKEVMKDLGMSDKPWFTASPFGIKIAPNTAGVVGMASELLNPLDPLNWVAPGVGKVGVKAVPKGMTLVEKAFGRGTAEELANKLGPNWINNIGKLKDGEPTITTVGQLVGVLGKKAMDKGISEGVSPEAISEIMLKAMNDKGLTASSRVVDKPRYALNMGVSVPIINKNLGRVNVPGTQSITTGLSRVMDRLGNTSAGQALGKSFATPGTWAPNTVPGSVWTRLVSKDAPKPSVDTTSIIPDVRDMTIESGQQAYKGLIKEAQQAANMATMREQDFSGALDTALKGLNDKDRKELMKRLVDPTFQLRPELNQAFNFLDSARKKMVEDYKNVGIEFTPLEDYVPFVSVGKPLTKDEAELLKGAFGPRIQRINKGSKDLVDIIGETADPHLLARTLNAVDPSEVNKVLGREWLTEDAGVAMARRGVKAIRGQEATTFLQGIMEKYGLKITDLDSVNGLPEGYVLVTPRIERSGRVMLDATKEAEGQAFAIPQEFANAYNEYTDLIFNPHAGNDLMRFFDQFTRAYKTVAYMWTPGHIPRDFMSNAYNLWLGGMRDFTPMYDAAKIMNDIRVANKTGAHSDEWSELLNPQDLKLEDDVQGMLDELGVKNLAPELSKSKQIPQYTEFSFPQWQGTSTELYDAVRELGLTESAGVLNEFQQVGKDWSFTMGGGPVGKYTEVMRQATRLNDNLARIAGVIDQLKKGKTLEQAVGATKKVLFDYNALTPFEKKFMKRVIPFYTWMRKNIPLQVEMILSHPGKYATTYKAMKGIGVPEDGTVPSFITQAGGLEVEGSDGKKREILPSLPLSDISKLPLSMETTRELMGSINPLIRALPEMATNTALFSGQPLENYSGELTKLPFASQLEKLGISEDVLPLIPKRTLGYLLNQIPPIRSLDVMTNPENSRQGAKITSFMGGPQVYPEDWASKAATYESRDKLRALVRVLEDKGVEVPSIMELEDNNSVMGDVLSLLMKKNNNKLNKSQKAKLKALGLL